MSDQPDNPFKFWEELRRRRVIRVIPVYAAAAFMLLELVDIISGPFGFPENTLRVVFILLCVGLVITVILSWIYDLTPEGVKKTGPVDSLEDQPGEKVSKTTGWQIATYVSVVIILSLVAWNIIARNRIRSGIDSGLEKSIAVLPFHNLSNDTTQVYFCDGVREEILLKLQNIDAFSVRSRTSADHYRNTEKTSTQIGEELNVNYLLAGSIGCEGNEIKIWVQLIDAVSDKHIWSGDYLKERTKIFSLQSEIAQNISSELKVVLSPEEIDEMDSRPTENLEAYHAYLQGRYYVSRPHFSIANWNLALKNFQEAVEIDTTFELAFAELARTHARLIYLRYDLSEDRKDKADRAAEKALELDPGSPRVHLALGYYYLYAHRDNKQALKHMEIAEKELPNNVEILVEKAALVRPQGRWEEYNQLLEKASRVSPRSVHILTELVLGLWCTRQYEDALAVSERAIDLAPDFNWPYIYKAYTIWSWEGPNQESREAIEHIDPEHEWSRFSCYFQESGEGNLQAALDLMSDTSIIWGVHHKMWTMPRTMMAAFIYDYLGQDELAREGYKAASEILEKKVMEVPDDPRYHSALGLAYAGIGKKEEAIKEGLKAVEILPVSKDAAYGTTYVHDLAINYIMNGEYDLALDQVEYLLSIPCWMSITWLEWEIRFAPLLTHPRFTELKKKYGNS